MRLSLQKLQKTRNLSRDMNMTRTEINSGQNGRTAQRPSGPKKPIGPGGINGLIRATSEQDEQIAQELVRQEEFTSVINEAISLFGYMKDGREQREVVDILNVFTSLRYKSRLRRFSDEKPVEYRMITIAERGPDGESVIQTAQIPKIARLLDGVKSGLDIKETPFVSEEIDNLKTEEKIINLCTRLADKDINKEEFVSKLGSAVVDYSSLALDREWARVEPAVASLGRALVSIFPTE